ncbi:MAG: multidrug efflux MFS transporter [bacterium]|nr:multidrug efflux MFS transporter [bacterium]
MHRWKQNLLALWAAQFFSIAGFSFALPFGPFYLQELGVQDPAELRIWSGMFTSAAGFAMAIMTPFWGYLADRFGKKPMTLRASLGGTIALLGMGLAHSPKMLLLFRFVQGGFTGTITAYLTLVVAETPQKRIGLAIGLMNAAVFCGNSIGPLAGGVFSDRFGFRAAFLLAAGLLGISFLLAFVFVRENFSPPANTSFSFFSDMKSLMLIGGVVPIVFVILVCASARTMQFPLLPLFVQELTDNPTGIATQTGLVSSVAGMASVLAGILVGALADRNRPMKIVTLLAFSAAVFETAIPFVTEVRHLTLLYFGAAFCIGGIDPLLKVLLTRIVPADKQGSAFGVIGSARAFGWFAGSLSGGILAAYFGIRVVFLIIAGLFASIGIFLSITRRILNAH